MGNFDSYDNAIIKHILKKGFRVLQIYFTYFCYLFSVGYDLGGVVTNSRKELDHGKKGVHLKDMHCLHPGDIYPFTRRPLFVIIDSDNSFAFQNIPKYFGQPLVTLMSPQDTPPTFQGTYPITAS